MKKNQQPWLICVTQGEWEMLQRSLSFGKQQLCTTCFYTMIPLHLHRVTQWGRTEACTHCPHRWLSKWGSRGCQRGAAVGLWLQFPSFSSTPWNRDCVLITYSTFLTHCKLFELKNLLILKPWAYIKSSTDVGALCITPDVRMLDYLSLLDAIWTHISQHDEAAKDSSVSVTPTLRGFSEYVWGVREAGMMIPQRIDSPRLSSTIISDLSLLSSSSLLFTSRSFRFPQKKSLVRDWLAL